MYAAAPSLVDQPLSGHSNHKLEMLSNFGPATGEPNPAIMLPFAVLLLAIGFGPLIAQYHWERHYHQLCVALTGVVCAYHLFVVLFINFLALGVHFGRRNPSRNFFRRKCASQAEKSQSGPASPSLIKTEP